MWPRFLAHPLYRYRLRNDLYCVEWGVKLYSNQSISIVHYSSWMSKVKMRLVKPVMVLTHNFHKVSAPKRQIVHRILLMHDAVIANGAAYCRRTIRNGLIYLKLIVTGGGYFLPGVPCSRHGSVGLRGLQSSFGAILHLSVSQAVRQNKYTVGLAQ